MKAVRAAPPVATFKVGDMVLVRRDENQEGLKLLVQDWSGLFKVRKVDHPRHILEEESKRKSRKPDHVRYMQRDFVPEQCAVCCYRSHTEEPCGSH